MLPFSPHSILRGLDPKSRAKPHSCLKATTYTHYTSVQDGKRHPHEERQTPNNTPSASELQQGPLLQVGLSGLPRWLPPPWFCRASPH